MASDGSAGARVPASPRLFPETGNAGELPTPDCRLRVLVAEAADDHVRPLIRLCRAAGYDVVQTSAADLASLRDGVNPQEEDAVHNGNGRPGTVPDAIPPRLLDTGRGLPLLVVSPAVGADAARQHLVERVERIQRLESLGTLAGRVVHDFNNFLGAIYGQTELLRMQLPVGHPALAHADEIARVSHQASELTQQLVASTGKRPRLTQVVDLSEIVREMTRLLEAVVGTRCRLTYACAPAGPRIAADIGQLRHIVLNLLINATEALGDGPGEIQVRTGWRTCDAAYLGRTRTPKPPAPGVYAWLEVADTGCGMTPEIQSHIFEPFFSTKPSGTGLGLGAILDIVQRQDGAVLVASAPGAGTTFTVLFPALADPLAAPAEATSPPSDGAPPAR